MGGDGEWVMMGGWWGWGVMRGDGEWVMMGVVGGWGVMGGDEGSGGGDGG